MEGRIWGLEVTEIVHSKSVAAARAGEYSEPKYWDAASAASEIEERIARKDAARDVRGGPYERYAVIIYTDEPFLLPEHVESAVRERSFGPVRLLTDVFVLMSYDPHHGHQPLYRANLGAS